MAIANGDSDSDSVTATRHGHGTVRPVRLLRVRVSEGDSSRLLILRGGIFMSVNFDSGSPGKFDSRTLNREALNRWTGRRNGVDGF